MKKLVFLTPQENCTEQGLSAENQIILKEIITNLLSANGKFNRHKRLLAS